MKTPDRLPGHSAGGRRVVLYTRVDCHLCDDALQVLREHGLEPECVDVDRDAGLVEQFGEWVPVVEIDGRVRFRGHVDPVMLRRLLIAEEDG